MFCRFPTIALCVLLVGTSAHSQRFPTNTIDSVQAAKIAATLHVGMPEVDVAKIFDARYGLKTGGDVGDSINWTRFYLLSDGNFLDLKMNPEEVANDGHWGGNGLLESASIQSNGVKILSISFTNSTRSNLRATNQTTAQLGSVHLTNLAIWRSPESSVQERAEAASRKEPKNKAKPLPIDRSIQIFRRNYGNAITYYAVLTNCSEATITLSMTLQNMSASTSLPLTVDAAGRSRFDLVAIQPIDPGQRWTHAFQYHFEIGRRCNARASSFAYALPYENKSYKVIQGPSGTFSHQPGSRSENAVDWAMPVGTTVCAARDGTVVAVRQDSDVGGAELMYQPCCNYVVIRHDDDTFGEYAHLQKDSLFVKLGQQIKTHDSLALSGNTGRSGGPHLHFAVFCTVDGNTRRTFPVQFMTKPGTVETLKQGESYP
jgi:murein DD-endopeptidase MepM/ murein hydrolase activator NlpD